MDNHDMVALGLRALLDDEPGITVVASVGSVAEDLTSVHSRHPDVVLMDYRLPDGT